MKKFFGPSKKMSPKNVKFEHSFWVFIRNPIKMFVIWHFDFEQKKNLETIFEE